MEPVAACLLFCRREEDSSAVVPSSPPSDHSAILTPSFIVRSLSAPLKMKLEALLHDNKTKSKEDRGRFRKESFVSTDDEAPDLLGSAKEEEWEREATPRPQAKAKTSTEAIPKRKRKIGQSPDEAAGAKRRWDDSKKKAESMWGQFLNRYFGSHEPTYRYLAPPLRVSATNPQDQR